MGYFSQLSADAEERGAHRREIPRTPKDQLLERISDLKERLEDFRRSPVRGRYATFEVYPDRALQKAILRFVLPEDLHSYDEVCSALILAEGDLQEMEQDGIAYVACLIPGQMFIRSAVFR